MSTNSTAAGTTLRPGDCRDSVQARIGDRNDADIRLDGAEGIVLRGRGSTGQRVVQRGLAHVRQSHNPALDAHVRGFSCPVPSSPDSRPDARGWSGETRPGGAVRADGVSGPKRRRSLDDIGAIAPVQRVHRALEVTGDDARDVADHALDRVLDLGTFGPRRAVEDIPDDAVPVSRMTDPDADSGEFGTPELRHHVPQPVVPAMASAPLEAYGAGRQVDFVVRDENSFNRNLVEPGDRRDRPAAVVHEGVRPEQPYPRALDVGVRD